MEGLVNVDVPEASDQGLVEEGGLDHSASAPQAFGKGPGPDIEGIRTQPGPEPCLEVLGVPGREQTPEPPGIDEVQLEPFRTPDQFPGGVSVVGGGVIGRLEDQSAGHAEPDHKSPSTSGCDVELFPLPFNIPDRGIPEHPVRDVPATTATSGGGSQDVPSPKPDARDGCSR